MKCFLPSNIAWYALPVILFSARSKHLNVFVKGYKLSLQADRSQNLDPWQMICINFRYTVYYIQLLEYSMFKCVTLTGQRPVPFLEAVCDRGDQTSMPRGGSYQEQQNCTTTRTLYNTFLIILYYHTCQYICTDHRYGYIASGIIVGVTQHLMAAIQMCSNTIAMVNWNSYF